MWLIIKEPASRVDMSIKWNDPKISDQKLIAMIIILLSSIELHSDWDKSLKFTCLHFYSLLSFFTYTINTSHIVMSRWLYFHCNFVKIIQFLKLNAKPNIKDSNLLPQVSQVCIPQRHYSSIFACHVNSTFLNNMCILKCVDFFFHFRCCSLVLLWKMSSSILSWATYYANYFSFFKQLPHHSHSLWLPCFSFLSFLSSYV